MSVIPRPPVTEKCWKEGCEEPRSDERNGYWCTRHHDERREKIKAEMARLADELDGIPRNHGGTGVPFVAHDITIHAGHNMRRNRDFWWWKCSCGQESEAESKNEGIAKSAGKRHVTGARRRAA